MKIVALLPFKNEAWILPTYLSSVTRIADEIVALDDDSTDSSRSLLEASGARIITHDFGEERVVQMSARRARLLEEGRGRGGTHFIWLDADETFSADFLPHAREAILALEASEKLSMRWVHLWKDTDRYLDDPSSPFGRIWKDFIVCDSPEYSFASRFLSEARTPGPHDKTSRLPEEKGVVLHFQFAAWHAVQMKQAWYRCMERIEGSRGPRRINQTYGVTLDAPLKTEQLPVRWSDGIAVPSLPSNGSSTHEQQIYALFDKYGLSFFEPLQIWHLPSLRERFAEKMGRAPRPLTYPAWLVRLNRIRNRMLHG